MQMCPSRTDVKAGPHHWDLGSNMVGGDTSAIALPQSSSTEDRRASPPYKSKVHFWATEPDGSGMVGESPQGSQWKSYSFATSKQTEHYGRLGVSIEGRQLRVDARSSSVCQIM